MSSHRILVRFLLLLPVGMAVLLSRASAEPLALFEDGIPGRVTGSEGLLPPFSCDSIPGLPPGEPFTGSAGLRATSPSLPAPEGERILALTTGAEGSPLAVTRWRYDFSLDGAAIHAWLADWSMLEALIMEAASRAMIR